MRRICRNEVSSDGIEIPFTEGKSYIFEISQNMKKPMAMAGERRRR
jgi:hypothetical protein